MRDLTHTIPAYTVPAVTKTYAEEVTNQVEKYMKDRHNFLCEGHHLLADLDKNPYIRSIASFFQLPFDEVAKDFHALGEKITEEKQTAALVERFKGGIQIDTTNIEYKAQKALNFRRRFNEERPTKGFQTTKMKEHRETLTDALVDLFGILIPDGAEVHGQNLMANNEWNLERIDNQVLFLDITKPKEGQRFGYDTLLEIAIDPEKNSIRVNEKKFNLK